MNRRTAHFEACPKGAYSKALEIIDELRRERDELKTALVAADHALASYAMGNASTELAANIHAHIESVLTKQLKP